MTYCFSCKCVFWFLFHLVVCVFIHPCIISISLPIRMAAACLSVHIAVCVCVCVCTNTRGPGESVFCQPSLQRSKLMSMEIKTKPPPLCLFLSPQN